MAKRQVFHSTRDKQSWKVLGPTGLTSRHLTQKDAEAAATAAGRSAYKKGGLGQAVLHKMDGSIREERTYGADPEKTPG